MTAAQGLYAENTTDTNVSSTTFTDVCSIAAGSFTAGATYLILACAIFQENSSANESRVRLVHGTVPTVFDDASLAWEQTATAHYSTAGWMTVFTQPGTAELVKIQAANSSTSTTTVMLGQIFALKLDDVGAQNTDWFYTEDLVDYTTTGSKVSKASVTFTPNGTDDWLIIGQFAQKPGATNSNYLADLNDSVAGVLTGIDIEGEDTTNEVRGHMLCAVVTPTNASHTFSMRFSHETTAGTVLSNRIFAINLNKFNQHAFQATAGALAPAASPTFTNAATIAPTPSVTGDWLILSYAEVNVNVSTDSLSVRQQIDPAGGGLVTDPALGHTYPLIDQWDPTDVLNVHLFKMLSMSTGGARTANLDGTMVAGTTLRMQKRLLVGFSLELASGAVADAGQATLIGVASGGDAETMPDAGQATLIGVASAADALTTAEAGQATTAATASGADAATVAEAGQATSAATGSAADAQTMADAGQATTAGTVSGADTLTANDAGQALSGLTASAADALTTADAGQATLIGVASAADALTTADAGQATLIGVASAADAETMAEAGQALAGLTMGGADSALLDEAGQTVLGLVASGADAFSGGAGTDDAGETAGTWAPTADDVLIVLDAGQPTLAGVSIGALDTLVMTDAGGGVLVVAASGSDGSAPPVRTILPYQGDATIYDSAGSTGAVASGTVQADATIVAAMGATGAAAAGAAQPSDGHYDVSGATGTIAGGVVLPSDATR